MIKTVVLWKWKRNQTGHQLPNVCDYGADHVNIMCRMIRRNTTLPVRIVVITDNPIGITEADHVTRLPVPVMESGGCYHRLIEFSAMFADVIQAESFIRFDLDAVIVGNIDHLIQCDDTFRINRYMYNDKPLQFYNGALVNMHCGWHRDVWDRFRPEVSPLRIDDLKRRRLLVGSDQAWISYRLGPACKTFGPEHGIYEAAIIGDGALPRNACVVFFSGARDPSMATQEWVRENWR